MGEELSTTPVPGPGAFKGLEFEHDAWSAPACMEIYNSELCLIQSRSEGVVVKVFSGHVAPPKKKLGDRKGAPSLL